ncbi:MULTISPECIES: shikimate dehydrogenase [unclassified Corynebacterium]|uniref:shikimate dehydrogenase n=1 Tax=unclassified Corynebacterium TaxID=2624378 RepID=UPI0021AA4D3A|nr:MULTISPECIES: shikimate dehydrogenase [unclassified Corynebacterium]MCT1452344.1 shikimate dehydrogenase [Corynebacterium sp. p3-SID1145]MCT1461260.1 shikimate dehydrogenase [Corynebacterium sp. p3-SID1140]MDN8593876.1 shikimate dehydrogenase [Corynebacterium sp. P4_F2]WKK55980.1 shikimate dehydrogenase [Corynebacterium sp. P4-C1]
MSTAVSVEHKAAVLGSPVEHSLSPVLHSAGFEAAGLEGWTYERIECDAERLPGLVGEAGDEYRGFSVTMPGKFAALEFGGTVTERAQAIGSANTLVREGSTWRADNTDCEGIAGALEELVGTHTPIGHALVIGAGGTARPALWSLAERGAEKVTVLNRSDRSAELLPLLDGVETEFIDFERDLEPLAMSVDLIISTVPSAALSGREKELGHAPLLDVIYNPWPTPLATRCASNGHLTVGGLVMLACQSYSQFEQFTGVPAPREEMREALFRHVGWVAPTGVTRKNR